MDEKLYREILFNGPMAYACHKLAFNPDGIGIECLITEANRNFAEICNQNPEQLENRCLTEVLPDLTLFIENWPVMARDIVTLKTGKEFAIPVKIRNKTYNFQVFSPVKDYLVTLLQITGSQEQVNDIKSVKEDRYLSLFNTMTLGVVYQNADGLITDANPAAQNILGLTLDQLKGRTSIDPRWKSIHEDGTDYPGDEHPILQALRTGKPVTGKIMGVLNPKTGTICWIQINSLPEFRNGESQPYQAYATFTDITERKIAEDLLRESDEKMTGIFNVAPAGIGFLKDRTFLKVNRMICAMTGYTADELLGKNARMLYANDEEYDFVGKEKYRQISLSGTGTVQTRWKRKDGTSLDIILSSTPIDQYDIGKGLIFTALDITEKKKAVDDLKESEEKFRSVFRISPDLVSITRLSDGQYVNVNDAFLQTSGFARDEIIGNTAENLGIWNRPTDRQKLFETLKKSGLVHNLEAVFNLNNGKQITGLMSASLLDIKGEPHLLAFTRDISERIKDQQKITELLDRIGLATKSSGMGIWDWDIRESKLTWDDQVYKLFGYSPETDKDPFEILMSSMPQEQTDAINQMREAALNSNGNYTTDYKIVLPDLSERYIKSYGKVITNKGGESVRIIGINYDITQQKLNEIALLASAEVAKAIPTGLAIYRASNDKLYLIDYNSSAVELSGINLEEKRGKEFDEIWTPGRFSDMKKEFLKVLKTHKHFTGTDISYNGKEINAAYTISAFRIQENTLGIAFEDITELKITEAKLVDAKEKAEENEALLRTIIENAPFEVWARDVEGIGILENQNSINHIGSILGIKPEQSDLPENQIEKWKSNNSKVFKGDVLNEECIYEINGEKIAYQQIISPIRKGNVIEGIVGFNIDINDRVKDHEEIRKLNEDLEKRVEERTTELQIVNKELEAFAYTVSHDLRAPLRAIDGFTNILKEDYEKLLDEEGKKVISIIIGNVNRMSTLIDDLLSFSRWSRSEINEAPVNMNDMVSQAYLEVTSSEQRIKINFYSAPLPLVMADHSLIKQVWINLISNAVKFSAKSAIPEIRITSEITDNKINFRISDNGVGFNMKYAGKLFGVFQRLHSNKDFEGTGVGLAIVQRIILRHGGSVWAHSEPDKGASFCFSLPVREL